MSRWICGRCEREAGVAYVCENCHKHVCKKCIVFKGGIQLCKDCAEPTEGAKINDEPVLVPA